MSKMVNTVRVNADHGRDFNPLVGHMIKLRNFTMGENRDFSAFLFSLHLLVEHALSNLIVCLTISQNLHKKWHTLASMLQWTLRRFGF